METFEEELEREPLDPDVVKIEVDALKAESEVPIGTLLATYGGAGAPSRLGGAAAAAVASDSSSDSDSESDSEDDDSSADDDEDDAGPHSEAVKSIGVTDPLGGTAVKRETDAVVRAETNDPRFVRPPLSALPDVASVTRESALAEGARIRYEDAVMDRAWSVLQRPPRTKPQPKFPEPPRNKTHWDHLLEEMR